MVSSKDIESNFSRLITDYPEVIKTIPILLAIRETEFPIVIDFFNIERDIQHLNFNKDRFSKISKSQAMDYLTFATKSGILNIFSYIKNFYDYVLGVEVGMILMLGRIEADKLWSLLLAVHRGHISNRFGFKMFFQERFKVVESLNGMFPSSLANRRADFVITSDK